MVRLRPPSPRPRRRSRIRLQNAWTSPVSAHVSHDAALGRVLRAACDMHIGRSCRKRLSFENRNNSFSPISSDLRRDNVMLADHNAELKERNRLLNQTLVQCISQDLAATLERAELMKEIESLTLTNVNLTDECRWWSHYKEEHVEMEAKLLSVEEDLHSLNHYCPVVNQNTHERVCKMCAEGWTMFQTKCYYFSSRALPWTSSRTWCQSHGADLLVIITEEEQVFQRSL
uniref:C-type lectin domain-containing protein n=1 Tax=Knipowitschia caucasica TaxID=637954 RepID=A0AAV2LI48_KNICA